MQTNFTKKQLQDSNISSADGILRKCVHCGFCNATCPTYQIVGDELDGPRGRIYLIKDMLENDKPANEKIAKHIDRCLSCYACMTTCPSGVNYMHLVDHARNHIEKTFVRPFFDRFIRNLLSKILPSPTLFRMAGYSARLFYPFRFLFPKKIKNMMKYMPNSFPVSRQENKEIYSPVGKTYARVALLTGCVQRVISPQINDATIDILNRHGVEVIVPKKVDCCGSLNHHLGKEELAHKSFINNINSWFKWYEEKNLDAILVTTSGCGTTLKDYGYIFRDHPDKELRRKAKMVSSLAKDVTEYLGKNIKLNYVKKDKKFTIAYHSACSMQHGQKIHNQPMDLLKKTGNEIVEIPDGHLCCGSAGTYNLLQDEMAAELLKRKVSNIDKVKPDFISTGNIGCMTQISSGTKIPIVHTIEILNWYTGGEKPTAINLL
ncbi:glycolate oxidase iron-sulfur subunit [Candidatus Pelagibacterales bacterium]|jgi:glycolate oxidase iron-sulfur subunit|nr:glycolate oxidase subunit GlcF [Candidatus Fonsibacter sp.]GDX37610.1 glycolate oxidase iron-sulfur subunit [Pelagibacterales bacterium]